MGVNKMASLKKKKEARKGQYQYLQIDYLYFDIFQSMKTNKKGIL